MHVMPTVVIRVVPLDRCRDAFAGHRLMHLLKLAFDQSRILGPDAFAEQIAGFAAKDLFNAWCAMSRPGGHRKRCAGSGAAHEKTRFFAAVILPV